MNRSQLFLLSIISTSVFSCTTIASEKDAQTQITLPISEQVLRSIPGFGRYVKGEPAARIVWDICTGTVNGLESVRQGVNAVRNSPTTATITNAVTTGAQAGAEILTTNAYSAGVTLCTATQNLYEWARTQRPTNNEEKQPTFHDALAAFKTNMTVMPKLNQLEKEKCKNGIIEELKIIKHDISLITKLINQAKGITDNNASGIRTTIIDHVIEKIKSDEITPEKAQDYKDIINFIAEFSKTEDGQNNFTDSFMGSSSIEPTFSDGESLLSELENAEDSVIKANVFKDFINKYMSNDLRMRTVLENKQQRIAAMELLKTDIEWLHKLVNDRGTTIQELMAELATTETQLNHALNATEKIVKECELAQQSITTSKQEKAQLNGIITGLTDAVTKSNEQLTQEKQRVTQLREKITSLKRYLGLTGLTLTGLLLLFILHKTDQLENFLNKLPIPSFSN
jgi:chromosome segregation ATPase